ncbi:fibroblast growth factor receptor-like isoform X4 [Hydra vulgaris]|uniref:Fibroblast growth factor receptor n=1 Tax=Hydra vulgaris TaxID=6087 RepID=A0ABM4BKA7_HYDVU
MISDWCVILVLSISRLVFGINFTEPVNYILKVGENNSSRLLDCSVDLSVELIKRIDWTYNGIVINKKPNVTFTDKGQKLIIGHYKSQNSGRYGCKVTAVSEESVERIFDLLPTSDLMPRIKNDISLLVELVMNKLDLDCTAVGASPISIMWLKNDKLIEARSNLRYYFSPNFLKLSIKEVRLDDAGIYKCILENKYGKVEHVMTVEIYEKMFAKPIVSSTDKHKVFYVDYGQNLTVPIYVTAFLPNPHFQMLYVYSMTNPNTNETKLALRVLPTMRELTVLEKGQRRGNSISHIKLDYFFTNISEQDFGNYTLMAGNKYGYDRYPFQILHTKYMQTTVSPPMKININKIYNEESVEKTVIFIVTASMLAGLIFVAFVILFICRVHSKDKFKNSNINYIKPLQTMILNLGDKNTSGVTMVTSVSAFSYANRRFRHSLNNNPVNDNQKCNLKIAPDPAWEIKLEQLETDCLLGEGAFGRVFRATARDLPNHTGVQTVAVKMLKEDCCEQDLKDFISEIEVMKSIGKHINILNLLAVSSQQGKLYIVVEYCCHGNLRSFLKDNRPVMQANSVITKKITLYDLTSFCLQVARGMNYLASKKCIHRDIAARNVLVGEGYLLKIADFGLARDVREHDYYRKCTDGRLPIKWMAIEALFDRIYTTQSDIWSFGILAWEIVTFGGSPYPGIALEKMFDLLKQGYRMEKPLNCTDDMYALMLNCWKEIPLKRPTFSQLIEDLEKMLLDASSTEYIDLQPIQPECAELLSTSIHTSASMLNTDLFNKHKYDHDEVSFTHKNGLSEADVLLNYQVVS